jgi:hypothetical protein
VTCFGTFLQFQIDVFLCRFLIGAILLASQNDGSARGTIISFPWGGTACISPASPWHHHHEEPQTVRSQFFRLHFRKTLPILICKSVEMVVGNGEVVGNGGAKRHRSEPEASRIRNNLMFKLGVEPDKSGQEVIREPSRGSLLGNVRLSKEPLKYVEDKADTATEGGRLWNIASMFTRRASLSETEPSLSSSYSSRDSSCPTEGSQARRLTFNEDVAICPIPKRDEYSKRIRERLWPTPEEMMLNAHRNSGET